jgi:eukaryotic-like serine/threonine-protein kinase
LQAFPHFRMPCAMLAAVTAPYAYTGISMDKTRWNRMQSLFDAALSLPESQRVHYLETECADDEDLLLEVRELVEAHTDDLPKWTTSIGSEVREVIDSRIGKHIGHHEIIEKIGVGGMGVIYKAYDARLDRHVALKFLPDFLMTDHEARERFMTEARAASRLDHPHICVIHDVNETADGQLYITMPYYAGETLDKCIDRGALTLTDALEIAIQISDGLAEAHRHHIVHRDIKPPNIMLTDNGAKILDFGIAKLDNMRLTSTGNSIGTVAYMAPEQLRGDPVDARADVWAVGASLFEMISGKRAFPGDVLPQIVNAVLYTNIDPLQSLSKDLPSSLHTLLQQCLARDIDQRFPDMDTLLDDLIRLRNTLTGKHQVNSTTRTKINTRFAWDEKLLQEFTDTLLPFVGPLAATLVSNEAKQAADANTLSQGLAEKIPSAKEREQFLQKIKLKVVAHTHPPVPEKVHTNGSQNGINLTPEELAVLENHFTPFIGPIAGALIRRATTFVGNFTELCQWLADQIPNERERLQFLERVSNAAK